uniref:VWFD domain-containing protein n=1 Tax=Dicentrarchus labrax TaxID=13489 RepID=A0A8P4GAB3_DICLA
MLQVGESFWTEGCSQRCQCHAPNDLRCSAASCTPAQECTIKNGRLGCFDVMSTCTVWGDPHYITFDGALTHFQGTCSYIISESMSNGTNETQFQIAATNNHRGNNRVSFVSAVDIYLSNQPETVNIRIGPNKRIMVNGSEVSLPTTAGALAQVIRQGNYIVVDAIDVIIQFDGWSTLLVRVGQNHKNRVTGMCGNFNNDPADDKVLPNGTLAQNDNDFGDSWKAPTSKPGENDRSTTNNNSSEDCGILNSSHGPFAQCWAMVEPQQHVNSCVEIIKASRDPASALCKVLRDYALMCQQRGVALTHWRNATDCEQNCPLKSHCELCGSSCPAACPSLAFPFSCDTACQEGCQCDDGFVLNGNQCVPPTACGCYHQGRYLQGGEQFWDGEECQSLCSCNGMTGVVHCIPCGPQESCCVVEGEFGCHPNPHGTCSASGDPHYLTFDGKAYDFQGTCHYVLVTLCNATDGLTACSL